MAEYFVSLSGADDGDGTKEKPWPSLKHALREVGGGNTITFLPGTYEPLQVDSKYAGTEEAPTVLRSERKWQAAVTGYALGLSACIGNATTDCPWVTVDGFEAYGAHGSGIRLFGVGSTVRNCWSHSNTMDGIGLYDEAASRCRIENNLIERNGVHPQFHHGIYARGTGLTVRGNVVRHNAGHGIQLCPVIKDSLIAYNLVHGHWKHALICGYDSGSGGNRILQNTLVGEKLGALRMRNSVDNLVGNNILTADGVDPITLEDSSMKAVCNLCWPTSQQPSQHTINADPKFLEPARGLYWLREGSPAIGAGSVAFALMANGSVAAETPSDFWGRPLIPPPDLGALGFYKELLDPAWRGRWYMGWAYGYPPNQEGYDRMPDLWALPDPGLLTSPD